MITKDVLLGQLYDILSPAQDELFALTPHLDEVFTRTRLGVMLEQRDLVSHDELEEALKRQQSTGRPIGELLAETGSADSAIIDFYLQEQHSLRGFYHAAAQTWVQASTQLGKLLTRIGHIGEHHLEAALQEQSASGKQLGEVLVDKGYLSVQQLHDALHLQFRLRQALLGALIALVSSAAVIPHHADAASSVASTSMSITLRILPDAPVVESADNLNTDTPLVFTSEDGEVWDAVEISQDEQGQFWVRSAEPAPQGSGMERQVDFILDEDESRQPQSGVLTLQVRPK